MMDGPLVLKKELDHGYVCCRGALGPLLNIKGHSVAFIQRFKAACIDAGVMYKYIRPVFLLDKTVAFFAVKPFHNSIRHRDTLLVKKFSRFQTTDCQTGNWEFLQVETGLPIKNGPLLMG